MEYTKKLMIKASKKIVMWHPPYITENGEKDE